MTFPGQAAAITTGVHVCPEPGTERGERGRRLVLVVLLSAWAAAAGCAMPVGTYGEERPGRSAASSFALYALSRGRGVPEPTRNAWQSVWNMLETARRDGKVARLEQTRIGLEGEVRLCAEFADVKLAQEMLERVRAAVKGVELLNLVEEPCSKQ
jgi:hypothetical protein